MEQKFNGKRQQEGMDGAIKWFVVLLCIAFAIPVLSGCQTGDADRVPLATASQVASEQPTPSAAPTPTKPPVIEIDAMEQVQTGVVVQNADGTTTQVDFDAAVIAPKQMESMTTYDVQDFGITQEQFDKVRAYFLGDAPLVDREGNPADGTLQRTLMLDYATEEEMLRLRQLGMTELDEVGIAPDTPENRKKLKDAGLEDRVTEQTSAYGRTTLENGKDAFIAVTEYLPIAMNGLWGSRVGMIEYHEGLGAVFLGYQSLSLPTKLSDEIPQGTVEVGLSSNQALEVAQGVMTDLGYSNYSMDGVTYAEYVDNSEYGKNHPDRKIAMYDFSFMMPASLPVKGLETDYVSVSVSKNGVESLTVGMPLGFTPAEQIDHIVPLNQETIEKLSLTLGEWSAASARAFEVNQNYAGVERDWMSPDAIKQNGGQVLRQVDMQPMKAPMLSKENANIIQNILVNRIKLEYICINSGDQRKEQAIPMWVFYGYRQGQNLAEMPGIQTIAVMDAQTGEVYPHI